MSKYITPLIGQGVKFYKKIKDLKFLIILSICLIKYYYCLKNNI